jgi:hypothetical protein
LDFGVIFLTLTKEGKMKSLKLLWVIAAIFVVVLIAPANGYIDPQSFKYQFGTNGDDHPWGGDDNGGDTELNVLYPGIGVLPSIFIDIIRASVSPSSEGLVNSRRSAPSSVRDDRILNMTIIKETEIRAGGARY